MSAKNSPSKEPRVLFLLFGFSNNVFEIFLLLQYKILAAINDLISSGNDFLSVFINQDTGNNTQTKNQCRMSSYFTH